MFPFWGRNWWYWYGNEPIAQRTCLERKLRLLRAMRDDLKTRLASIDAAISSVEQQLSQEDTAA